MRAPVGWMPRFRHAATAAAGFTLVELLLALALGLCLSGVMLQGLLADGQNSQRWTRLLRERQWQRRTLELIRGDLQRASAVSLVPELESRACQLGGRLPVLHLSTSAGPITYTVGSAPSAIWRGQVLMRCGPAFGLDGQPSSGSQPQNRVVIDGLAAPAKPWDGCAVLLGQPADGVVDLAGSSAQPFSACQDAARGLVGLRLLQEFRSPTGPVQRLQQELLVGLSG